LTVEFSVAAELADQAFASEEAADQTLASFSNSELKRFFEGDDVPGVDGELSINFDFVDRSEAAEEEVAMSRAFDPEHSLATEESFAQALPTCVDFDSGLRRQPARSLNDQCSVQRVMDDVAHQLRAEDQALPFAVRAEMVQEEVLSREHSLEPLHHAAFASLSSGSCFDGHAARHRDHRTNFGCDRFAGRHSDVDNRGGGLSLYLVLHVSVPLIVDPEAIVRVVSLVGRDWKRALLNAASNPLGIYHKCEFVHAANPLIERDCM
jgi:hypothetical protein